MNDVGSELIDFFNEQRREAFIQKNMNENLN